jgi:hypothetical protein
MRRILSAISAKATQPLRAVAQQEFAVRGEDRHGRPLSERGKHALPAVEKRSLITASDMMLKRGQTKSVKNVAEGERGGGTGDHGVLLRSYKLPMSLH